jgi:hypothetical protein
LALDSSEKSSYILTTNGGGNTATVLHRIVVAPYSTNLCETVRTKFRQSRQIFLGVKDSTLEDLTFENPPLDRQPQQRFEATDDNDTKSSPVCGCVHNVKLFACHLANHVTVSLLVAIPTNRYTTRSLHKPVQLFDIVRAPGGESVAKLLGTVLYTLHLSGNMLLAGTLARRLAPLEAFFNIQLCWCLCRTLCRWSNGCRVVSRYRDWTPRRARSRN